MKKSENTSLYYKRKYYISRNGKVFPDILDVGLLAINIIDYIEETDKYFIVGRTKKHRIPKQQSEKIYFETWELAHEALKKRAAKQLKDAEQAVLSAERIEMEINSMIKPNFREPDLIEENE